MKKSILIGALAVLMLVAFTACENNAPTTPLYGKAVESIKPEQHDYFRVASVDSPFREQIVWAYMINSCRPGMPDRNMDLWAKELMKP